MTVFEKNVISIIRAALTGEKPEFESKPNYDGIYKFSVKQQLQYLLFNGLLFLPDFENSEIYSSFFEDACKAVRLDVHQDFEVSRIVNEFEKHGIDYMLIKGICLKKLYPVTAMRSMGDIDILIRKKQLNKISNIMRELDYKIIGGTENEVPWHKENLLIEMHRYLMPPNNPDLYKFYNGNEWDNLIQIHSHSHEYAMNDEDNLVFLILHFVKHFRYSGAGIRNICDLYLFLKNHTTLNESYIKNKLEKFELYEFYLNIKNVISCWFYGEPTNDIVDIITGMLFKGGIFGAKETMESSENIRLYHRYRYAKIAKIKTVVFPNVHRLKIKYRVLYKMPFLLPIIWVIHWFEVIIKRPETVKKVKNDINNMVNDKDCKRNSDLEKIGLRVWYK